MVYQTENTMTTKCLYVSRKSDDKKNDQQIMREVRTFDLESLVAGWVRIRVKFSSLNYKDALCANGHPGVAKTIPIVPGIDAAGVVLESTDSQFKTGESVMVFHGSFGTEVNGGYSEIIDVPSDWVYRIPDSLTARDAMTLGTAGFTAAQCIDELQKHDVTPDRGEVIVTGATGGVGICAVKLLSQLGYDVVASTGKPDKTDWLQALGANRVIRRELIDDKTDRPLLKGQWAGAIDTVGGNTLATVLRSTLPHGCVTACGLVGGVDLLISVYPFILRGITLQGIDSAGISRDYRKSIWDRIGSEWRMDNLDELAIEVDLDQLEPKILDILDGRIAGRVVVKVDPS